MTAAPAQPQRIGSLRSLAGDSGYILSGFPLAVASFSVIVTGLSSGVGLLIIVVGLPVLTLTVVIARLFADIERFRIPGVLRRPRTRPTYRTSQAGQGLWKRITTPLTQTQSWLDVAFRGRLPAQGPRRGGRRVSRRAGAGGLRRDGA